MQQLPQFDNELAKKQQQAEDAGEVSTSKTLLKSGDSHFHSKYLLFLLTQAPPSTYQNHDLKSKPLLCNAHCVLPYPKNK